MKTRNNTLLYVFVTRMGFKGKFGTSKHTCFKIFCSFDKYNFLRKEILFGRVVEFFKCEIR